MDNKKAEKLYGQVLYSVQYMRNEIMNELADILPFGGTMSEEDSLELQTIAGITGEVFAALNRRGFAIEPVPGKTNLVKMQVSGVEYVCSKSCLDKTSPLQRENQALQDTPKKKKQEASRKVEVEPPEKTSEEPTEFSEQEFPIEEESPIEEEFVWSPDEAGEKEDEEKAELPPIPTFEADDFEEEKASPSKARVIGGEPVVSNINHANVFVEEKRKAAGEFVFDTYRISVAHGERRGGGKAEEMFVMIAPLKIQRFSCPSVPILVSIYYKGRMWSKSSYDVTEEGKNLVNIDVNEFYFLCRGSFNEKGEFQSAIMTTGISSDQGDILNLLGRDRHKGSGDVKNGHLKFRYDAEEGDGIIEVFPLDIGEKEFVIIAKNKEFVDYLHISKSAKSLNHAIVYEDGVKKEVVCNWDGDFLEADLVEV